MSREQNSSDGLEAKESKRARLKTESKTRRSDKESEKGYKSRKNYGRTYRCASIERNSSDGLQVECRKQSRRQNES